MIAENEKKTSEKKVSEKKVSFMSRLGHEWKSLTKPSGKDVFVSTFRTVCIAVVAAILISAVDFSFTQMLLLFTR